MINKSHKERYKYLVTMRRHHQASMCPNCIRMTRHLTIPGENDTVDVKCEYCDAIVLKGLTGLKPYIPVKLTKDKGVVPAE